MATIEEMMRGQRVQLGSKKGTVYYAEPPFMDKPGFATIDWDDGSISKVDASDYGPICFPSKPDRKESDFI